MTLLPGFSEGAGVDATGVVVSWAKIKLVELISISEAANKATCLIV